jgi:hypothetical protein
VGQTNFVTMDTLITRMTKDTIRDYLGVTPFLRRTKTKCELRKKSFVSLAFSVTNRFTVTKLVLPTSDLLISCLDSSFTPNFFVVRCRENCLALSN